MINEEQEKAPEAEGETGAPPELNDAESLRKALEEEKTKTLQYLYNWQRAQADLLNYKKTSEKERQEAVKYGNSHLVMNLLPVLDDLQRAVAALPADSGAAWTEGIKLIQRKLQTSLEANGLVPVNAVGLPFDPFVHEAISYQEGEENVVLAEVEKGYKFYDRLLRPARVIVGNGIAEQEKKEERKKKRE